MVKLPTDRACGGFHAARKTRDIAPIAWKTDRMRGEPERRAPTMRRACATRVLAAAVIASAFLGAPFIVRAQQYAPAMPDTSGGANGPLDGSAAAAQGQPSDPMNSVDDTGDSATVSIPGGGEVQAQGPPASAPSAPIPPNETWGASRIDPNGSGTTPMGPQ
jgi:hypothetical protein